MRLGNVLSSLFFSTLLDLSSSLFLVVVGLLAATGFLKFATPFVDAYAYKHAENWVFHVSFEGSYNIRNLNSDDIDHA